MFVGKLKDDGLLLVLSVLCYCLTSGSNIRHGFPPFHAAMLCEAFAFYQVVKVLSFPEA